MELLLQHRVHAAIPDQVLRLAEASWNICPSLAEGFQIPFSFPAFLILWKPEEMVIFAEVICPLWTLSEWTNVLYCMCNETSTWCHQRDKLCPQMSERARNYELCTCLIALCASSARQGTWRRKSVGSLLRICPAVFYGCCLISAIHLLPGSRIIRTY